jgi:hypothetical protein
MATVIAQQGSANARPRARAARSKIYVGLALMITAIVFAGFAPSFYGTFVAGTAHPWIIHVHAAVYVGWLALLVAQSVLAARGRIATHKRVGSFGIAYGALVWTLGVAVAFAMPVINFRSGAWPMARAESFLAVPLGDMVLFGGFFAAAIAYRARPEIHKRLIVLAAVAVMFAAVGRAFTAASTLVGDTNAALGGRTARLALWYSPVLVAMAHDLATKRRIHPVYLIGAAVMAVLFLRVPYSQTDHWRAIARAARAVHL